MAQLSEKELSSLHDMLSEEDLLVKKFKMLADQATDPEVKNKLTEISNKHQGHFNTLYSQLKQQEGILMTTTNFSEKKFFLML